MSDKKTFTQWLKLMKPAKPIKFKPIYINPELGMCYYPTIAIPYNKVSKVAVITPSKIFTNER